VQVCLPIVAAENWKPATKTDQVTKFVVSWVSFQVSVSNSADSPYVALTSVWISKVLERFEYCGDVKWSSTCFDIFGLQFFAIFYRAKGIVAVAVWTVRCLLLRVWVQCSRQSSWYAFLAPFVPSMVSAPWRLVPTSLSLPRAFGSVGLSWPCCSIRIGYR
jgi:hypothetical protein